MTVATKPGSTPQPPQRNVQRPERLAFTFDAASGEVLKFESVDPSGQHGEVADSYMRELAQLGGGQGLEALFEQAFEAGIGSVLGGDEEEKTGGDTEEEAGLRSILLQSLIERSPAATLLRREVLRRSILQTLIQSAVNPGDSGKGSQAEPASELEAPKASN